MPPIKQPPKPKTESASNATLILAIQNMEQMIRFYRRSRHPGHDVGHIVMCELTLTDVSAAFTLAVEGKSWVAPKDEWP